MRDSARLHVASAATPSGIAAGARAVAVVPAGGSAGAGAIVADGAPTAAVLLDHGDHPVLASEMSADDVERVTGRRESPTPPPQSGPAKRAKLTLRPRAATPPGGCRRDRQSPATALPPLP